MATLLPRRYIATYSVHGRNGLRRIVRVRTWARSDFEAETRAKRKAPPGWRYESVRRLNDSDRGKRATTQGASLLLIAALWTGWGDIRHSAPSVAEHSFTPAEDEPGWNCEQYGNKFCYLLGKHRYY